MPVLNGKYVGPNQLYASQNEEVIGVYPTAASIKLKQDPTLVSRAQVIRQQEFIKSAKAAGISESTLNKIPALLLTEDQANGGVNQIDYNNSDSVALQAYLEKKGFSIDAARFATALSDAERRAKQTKLDVFEVWNGRGKARDRSGKVYADAENHARKVEEAKSLFLAPENAEYKRLLFETPTAKDLAITRTKQEIADTYLGNKGVPIYRHNPYKDGMLVDRESSDRMESEITKRIGYKRSQELLEASSERLVSEAAIQLMRDTEMRNQGVKSGRLEKSALTTPEFQALANQLRYLDSPEMKESPPPSKSVLEVLKSLFF